MASKIDEFMTDYEKISTKMLGVGSTQETMLKSISELFEDFSLNDEMFAKVVSELAIQTAIQYNKDAIQSTMDVLKIDLETNVNDAKVQLLIREKQGFDDNMLLKNVEYQSGLASFAVNAGSDSAQTTIDDLKAKMAKVESRVLALDGSAECPTIVPTTPVPSNLTPTLIASTTIDLSWSAVVNATQYLLYRDGVLISTSSSLTFQDTGLDISTKYAYTVKASINGVMSDYSSVLSVRTLSGA